MVAVTLPFVAAGLSLWATAGGHADAETLRRLAASGIDDPAASRLVLQGTAAMLLGTCAWTAMLGLGVATRWSWARLAGILTFLLFTLIAVPHGIAGMALDPRPAGAGQAVLVGLVDATVLWLLSSQELADDVARARFYRRRRRRSGASPDTGGGPDGGASDPPVLAA